jgi:SAM-dependent methyltransferase
MAAQLAGPNGRIIGLDMTDEQLAIARRNIEPHMDNFGFEEPTTEFIEGRIEEIPLDDESVDVVISNCVINLSPDKQAVFAEIWRVLKPGGEFYISDIVADRRVPDRLQQDEKLWSECLTGALYTEDLRRVEARAGFADTRVVDARQTGDTIEGIHFTSQVRRGFKLDLEDRCEDYGQVAVYRGTLPGRADSWALDEGHHFPAGEPVRICKNTADMLTESRFSDHFRVSEPLGHLGLFEECGNVSTADEQAPATAETGPPSSVSLDSESTSADNADSSSGGCC